MYAPYEHELEAFQVVLLEGGVAAKNECTGCTDEDLESLRTRLYWIPAAYEWFLRRFGRGAGDLWVGSTVFFPDLLELDASWLDELAGELNVVLPPHERLV